MLYRLSILLFVYCCSCTPSRFVKPLAKNEQAVNLSVGGPIISSDALTVPAPFLSATYGYGFDSSLTGFGSVNLTSAFYGNLQIELGFTKGLWQQHGKVPGISISPVANIVYRPKTGTKIYPQLDVNAYWDFNRHHNFFYVGINNWFELSGKKASGLKQQYHWLISPMVGQTFVRKKWDFTIEIKVIAPNLKNNYSTVEYKTPLGTNGAFGMYLGYTRKF